jgi:hypothetical protein
MVQANGTPEKNGNVALRIDVTNESGTIKYMIGYVNGKQIGAVKMVGPQMFLVVFDESDNQYIASIWVGEQCLMERIITEQEAVEWAKTVFIYFTGKPING